MQFSLIHHQNLMSLFLIQGKENNIRNYIRAATKSIRYLRHGQRIHKFQINPSVNLLV